MSSCSSSCSSCWLGLRSLLSKQSRRDRVDSFDSNAYQDCIDPEDLRSERETNDNRERILKLVEHVSALNLGSATTARSSSHAGSSQGSPRSFTNSDGAHSMERFYSVEHLEELFSPSEIEHVESFHRKFLASTPRDGSYRSRKDSLAGYGPYGNPSLRGGDKNTWDDVDVTTYNVRGPAYLKDGKKVQGQGLGAELVVVDFFNVKTDIANICESTSAGTIQRLRRQGETRKLFVLNFRISPMQLVIVWALPEMIGNDLPPALALLRRFISKDMTDADRKRRVKVIPRMVAGPWVARMAVGSTPSILGKNIPMDFFAGDNEFEVSVGVAASSAARRIVRALKSCASAFDIEVVIVIEGQAPNELPEQPIGGFRMKFADVGTLRPVEDATLSRPSFL